MSDQTNYIYTNDDGTKTYYLNSKEVTLRGGRVQPIYYFSKDNRPSACPLPEGFEVVASKRNGFPVVRRIK